MENNGMLIVNKETLVLFFLFVRLPLLSSVQSKTMMEMAIDDD
jgi:hypothetical protein